IGRPVVLDFYGDVIKRSKVTKKAGERRQFQREGYAMQRIVGNMCCHRPSGSSRFLWGCDKTLKGYEESRGTSAISA
ncbi:hypothetical protein, partial [Enterobacter hormaechei]|uniref:hypothetical protein n=1 Tax=Enterobacter hormaechei TaxID=158836 RepID=UPI00197AB8A0